MRSAARWSWQRSSGQLANAHGKERTTKEYLRADRLALRRSPRSRSERIQPEAGASTVARRVTDRLPANEEGVSFGVGTAVMYSNEKCSPTAPISSRTLWRDSSFADDRGRARSATVVRRFRGPCLEIARVVSGAARGVKRAGTLWWFFPDMRVGTSP